MTEGEHSMEDRARIFAPVLAQVKRLADEGKPVAIAIDGRCGSGKTWLSGLIGDRFPCNILHMDDFYLPFGRRAQGWEAVPGGNTALAGALLAGRRILSGETMADAVQGEGDRPCAGTGIIGSAAHTLAVQLERMAGDTEVVNLAMEAGFDGRYVENMDFPHWDVSGQGA